MTAKRDRLTVIHDILRAIQKKNRLKPTHIQYKANLSSQMLKDYLQELLQNDLVLEEMNKRSKTYTLTTKGHKYLQEYEQVKEFMNMFGI